MTRDAWTGLGRQRSWEAIGLTSTDGSTLVLDVLARALLGALLRDALLVHVAGDDRPGDVARVIALVRQRLALGCAEPEDLQRVAGELEEKGGHAQVTDVSITADGELALGR